MIRKSEDPTVSDPRILGFSDLRLFGSHPLNYSHDLLHPLDAHPPEALEADGDRDFFSLDRDGSRHIDSELHEYLSSLATGRNRTRSPGHDLFALSIGAHRRN